LKSVALGCVLSTCLAVTGCAKLRIWNQGATGEIVGRVSARDGPAVGDAVVFVEQIGQQQATGPLAALLIRQRLGRFEPDFAVAVVGQRVTFSNQDEIFHGIFSYSRSNRFEVPPFAPGQARTVSFRHSGVVELYSPINSAMRGKIVVVPERHYAIPDPQGDYRISALPAGRYRLSFWAEYRQASTREIELTRGEVERADFEVRRAIDAKR